MSKIVKEIHSSKKKQIAPACRWAFTFNNYTYEEWLEIREEFVKVCKKYVIGKEVGDEGTPHLQGFVSFKKKLRPLSLALPKKIHWEKAKGTDMENYNYCTKDMDYIQVGFPEEVKVFDMDLGWQLDVLDVIKTKPCRRTIYWIWSYAGCMRKTETCRYLVVKHGACIFGGKAADVRNGVAKYYEKHGDTPKVIVMNIPRSFGTEYVSYEGMENIKDMLFYSGKYEGDMICGNPPHFFVFCNFPPPEGDSKMSADRYVIKNLDEGTERFL